MGIPSGRPPPRPPRFNPVDRALFEARSNGKIFATEAARIIRLAKEGGLDSRERALIQRLSNDTFATPLARRLFAEVLERRPPKLTPKGG